MNKGTTMVKPLRDLLLITLEEKSNQTESGFYVAQKWESAQKTAKIDAVGPDVEGFKKGERIFINPYAVIDYSDKQCFVKQGDILAKL